MVTRAVMHQLGLLVQQPLLSALRPLLQNFPQMLRRAAHSSSPDTAASLFGQLQYQIQQVLLELLYNAVYYCCLSDTNAALQHTADHLLIAHDTSLTGDS